jgi:hypothetical protein
VRVDENLSASKCILLRSSELIFFGNFVHDWLVLKTGVISEVIVRSMLARNTSLSVIPALGQDSLQLFSLITARKILLCQNVLSFHPFLGWL